VQIEEKVDSLIPISYPVESSDTKIFARIMEASGSFSLRVFNTYYV